MADYTKYRTEEVEEEIVQESNLDPDGMPSLATDRREQTRVVRDVDSERREQIVEDVGAERRAIIAKVTGFIWLLTGLVEAAIGLRVILKLIAANPANPFANLVYTATDLFLWPFQNLVANPTAGNGMVLEITSLIAMVLYALLAMAATALIRLVFSPSRSRRVSVYRREEI